MGTSIDKGSQLKNDDILKLYLKYFIIKNIMN